MGVSFRPLREEFPAAFAGLERRVEVQERIPSGLKTIGPHHLAIVPSCLVSRSANQTIANNTPTDIQWTVEDRDNSAMHNPADDTKIAAPLTGIYLAEAWVSWAANVTGFRQTQLRVNGNRIAQSYVVMTGADVVVPPPITVTLTMVAGDYIQTHVTQGSGGNLDVLSGLLFSRMGLTWLGNP